MLDRTGIMKEINQERDKDEVVKGHLLIYAQPWNTSLKITV